MNRAASSFRLEQALHFWEDLCFLLWCWVRISLRLSRAVPGLPLRGAIINAPQFRQHLLGLITGSSSLRTEDFGPTEESPEYANKIGSMAVLPLLLARWTTDSRRIYRMSEDLQLTLRATTIRGLRWSDASLPFESFSIALQRPIVSERGSWDNILFARHHLEGYPGRLYAILLLPSGLATNEFIREQDKRRMQVQVANKDLSGYNKSLERVMRTAKNYYAMVSYIGDGPDDPLISGSMQSGVGAASPLADQLGVPAEWNQVGRESPELDEATRYVIGLGLYLRSLPPGSPHRSDWEPHEPYSLDSTAITDPAQGCLVQSAQVLTVEERELLARLNFEQVNAEHGSELRELGVHFRGGCWRRRPGFGNDPAAPRCVHVRWSIVNAHRLADGSLPQGLKFVLKLRENEE